MNPRSKVPPQSPAKSRTERASMLHVVREVLREAKLDGIGRRAAALSFFAMFSLPAMLVLVITFAGTVYGPDVVETQFLSEVRGLIGESGARALREMIQNASPSKSASISARVIGIGALLLGATGFFLQLQDGLNTIWSAKRNAKRNGIVTFLIKRFLSFGMILGVALLLLVSLALSVLLSAGGRWLADGLSIDSEAFGAVVEIVLSGGLTATLFAAIYKVLPDLKIAWREVWLGGIVAAALFSAGRLGLGAYLARSDLAAGYGATGPLVVILVWVYFVAFVSLLGAEFTQVYARLRGPRRAERSGRMKAKALNDPDVHGEKGE